LERLLSTSQLLDVLGGSAVFLFDGEVFDDDGHFGGDLFGAG
jgi:hypothetical protein